jgi:site-specific DNA-methyltransferase (adenine-specific)
MQGDKALFSSESVEWSTPQPLFDWLNKKHKFDLDPSASDANHKCEKYFTRKDNGLKQSWREKGKSAFMNPPYNKPEAQCQPNCKKKRCLKRGYHNVDAPVPGIIDWMKKAYDEACNGMDVVCLVPNRSDTEWYERYAMKADEIYQIKSRLKFVDHTKPECKPAPATFPSIVICFYGSKWVTEGRPERPKLYYIKINNKTNEITVI